MIWIPLALAGEPTMPDAFRTTLTRVDSTRVMLEVTNTSGAKAEFCTYHTPFEGIRNDIFVVERDGEELPYRGMMAKRAPPTKKDHRTLKPGASITSEAVDLSETYALKSGTYTVRFRGGGVSGLPDSAPIELVVAE